MFRPRPTPGLPWIGPDPPGFRAGVPASDPAGWKRWPAPRPAASRPFGRSPGRADGLDGVGREALLDVAAGAGTRSLRSGSLRLVPPSVVIGGADRGRWGRKLKTLQSAILRSRRWLGGSDPRVGGRLAAAGLACG